MKLQPTHIIGRAGELRVQSELLLRGINSAMVAVDNGCDLILYNGKKIQVKTSRLRPKGKYFFTFMSGTVWRKNGHRVKTPQDLSEVDFVICWCVEDNWFFIIPTYEVTSVALGIFRGKFPNKTKSKYAKYLNKWELLL